MQIIKSLLLACSLLLLVGCDNEALLTQLNQRQSNEVMATLQQNGILASKRENGKLGFSIYVAKQDFVASVDLLKQYNLPSKDQIEIVQAFPGDSLVASPQAERSRLLSMIEQRLEQSIAGIPGVVNAKVHVSYPLAPNNSGSNRAPPKQHVSCLITYAGSENKEVLINKVKIFLRNSFSEVDFDDVSVVVLDRPAIQRSISSEGNDASGNIIYQLLIAVTVIITLLLSLVLFFWRTKKPIPFMNKQRQEEDKENGPDERG
ncbi:Lipoprotein prgK precursor [Serratia quinivorans]|uniref:type III secretion system inner membrane ring lipoprotein SctJ n=1 Tax=Serratia quinivorans TaxID=137545 RepID=UPI002178B215|nr:type III secretion inner membrane ring lipoprotein SctJ [Serratia quinivorans]CAI1905417.1 Lipoprotein prgK precursor [Serratia quinivorans]